jgi:hypothetical protein
MKETIFVGEISRTEVVFGASEVEISTIILLRS